jgi:CDP-glucose 4,6-dehydratase
MIMEKFWKEKRVLVTGATGLVGSWLNKKLVEEGAYAVTLVRDPDPQSEFFRSGVSRNTTIVQGALEDFASVERAVNEHEIDTVFHLGAQTIVGTALRSPLSTFESNIRGSYNLLEACRRHSSLVKRVIIASSDKAYGSSDILPYTEEMPLGAKHPYDVSKSCTDLLAFSYYHTYGLPIVVARCGNIFGGGDLNWSRIIPGTIRNYYLDEAPVIRSDGTLTRDYVYVEDVVNAYMLLAANLHRDTVKGQAFNFGPNAPYSVLEIVGMLQKLMHRHHLAPKILNISKAEIHDQSLSSEKARLVLNWSPTYTLEEGLTKTIEWYQNYFESLTPMAGHGL